MKRSQSPGKYFYFDVVTGSLRFTTKGKERLEGFCRMVGENIDQIKSIDDFNKMLSKHHEFVRKHFDQPMSECGSSQERRNALLTHIMTGNEEMLELLKRK